MSSLTLVKDRVLTLEQLAPMHLVTIWAEQNGAVVNGRWNYSWGNGNEHTGAGINDWGWVAPYDGTIEVLTIGMRLTNVANTTAVVTINGVDAAAAIIAASGSTTKARLKLTTPVAFNAGDTLNFRTLSTGGGDDVVVAAAILLDTTT